MKTVDLFAGVGGATVGTIMAGANVLAAANHSKLAIKYHSLNHPDIKHFCQDLHQMDWGQMPSHDLVWASPSCTSHSDAGGGKNKHNDKSRATAWAVVGCAEYHQPEFLVVENVVEFLKWVLFEPWVFAMKKLGYSYSLNILDSSDYGVPQERERLFVIFSRGKRPFCLQKPLPTKKVAAREIINWDHPMNLINKPGRAEKTLKIIEKGRERFGNEFLLPYYGTTEYGRSLERPLGTVTTVDRFALIVGDRMRMLQVDEYKLAMGVPENYILPPVRKDAIFLLGNGVTPPVPQNIIAQLIN